MELQGSTSHTPNPVTRMLKSSGESEAPSKWWAIASSRLSCTMRRGETMLGVPKIQ